MQRFLFYICLMLVPWKAFAAGEVTDLKSVGVLVKDILGTLYPILLAIAIFAIIYGIYKFIVNAADEEARKTGRLFILWGVIGVFLMLSVWGLVRILTNTIIFEDTTPYNPPGGTYNIAPVRQ